MNPIELKSKLANGGKVYGTMLWAIDSARMTSFLDNEYLDYAIIEAEHAPRTLYQINSMTSALRSKNITSIVRITSPNPEIAGATIDAGADGILVPYCEDIEELKLSFGRTYFNPLKGEYLKKVLDKGIFPSKKSEDYLREKSKSRLFILGIESVPAVNNLEKMINSVEKIDGIFVGPNDLTTSMGIPDERSTKEYEDILKEVVETSEKYNIPVMIHHANLKESGFSIKIGSRFVLHGSDVSLLNQKISEDFKKLKEEKIEDHEGYAADKPY